ncbi:gdsl esterase/lipase 4 [Quercus suber]|uniref:Gdsl esterase/lipase 4 n=1 Tax=Quercus suber TaxID=58331 RepID=A0AAW0M7Q7_QUESU
MLGPKISYQEAKQEPIFLTMELIFLTLDPLEGSVMALTVQMFLFKMYHKELCKGMMAHYFLKKYLTLMKFGKENTPSSSKNQKKVISLAVQILQFPRVQNDLMGTMGQAAMEKFLSKSLVFISIGSNDIFAYYHSNSSLSKQDFMSNLLLTYENHLKDLLNLGARKFGIMSVPPTGCCPSHRIYNATGGAASEFAAIILYGSPPTFVAPINFFQLTNA